ncbi:MAG: peptidylprolyl isomerase [Bacteroidetes bacterium]|nr:MAG: peptidylprolyl isomerase [Bacteroidota bacterium]
MKNLINMLSLSLLFFACENAKKEKKVERKEDKKVEIAKKVDLDNVILDKKNVKQVLTDYAAQNSQNLVLIKTSLGDIKVRLYDETPLHRANFIRLVRKKVFNSRVFHRVIKKFVIQGGGTDNPKLKKAIGQYTIPPEFNPKYLHKRGALAMARDDDAENPKQESSSHYFYIVQGVKYNIPTLNKTIKDNNLKLSAIQIQTYTVVGGTPHLDGKYTVFGEVIEGLEIVDKIAAVEVDKGDWPLKDVSINMEIIE